MHFRSPSSEISEKIEERKSLNEVITERVVISDSQAVSEDNSWGEGGGDKGSQCTTTTSR